MKVSTKFKSELTWLTRDTVSHRPLHRCPQDCQKHQLKDSDLQRLKLRVEPDGSFLTGTCGLRISEE